MPSVCTSCGAELPPSRTCQQLCDELYAYTLALGDSEFIHQHVVDAYAAQHITQHTKPISQCAALVGLYLFAEQGYTGRQVQQGHMALGNAMKQWELLAVPAESARLTVCDVIAASPGKVRNERIKQWARAVWEMWRQRHAEVGAWTRARLQHSGVDR